MSDYNARAVVDTLLELQARLEAAEKERDEALERERIGGQNFLVQLDRANAAEARLAEWDSALSVVGLSADAGPNGLIRHHRNNAALAAGFELEARLAETQKALKAADDLLAGMWSFNDDSRKHMAHTYPVMASDVLRAALTTHHTEQAHWCEVCDRDDIPTIEGD